MRKLMATGALAIVAVCALAATLPASERSVKSSLVGRWERTTSCQQLVAALKRAGLGATVAQAWVGQTSSTGESSFKPGSPKPTSARPCAGAIPRVHSHFFTNGGQFGSLDWKGGQVDDGPYRIAGVNTVQIGAGAPAARFRFEIRSRNTLTLTPILTKAMIRQANAHPNEFSAAFWAVTVAYPGHTWKRVPCTPCR